MTYRVKDTAPQAVKDIENEPETIEVVDGEDGTPTARATWRDHVFLERLPRGCHEWEPDEIRSLMQNTARRLKVKIAKAKWKAMAELADAAADTGAPEELTELDFARLARAQAKREKRATRRAARHD